MTVDWKRRRLLRRSSTPEGRERFANAMTVSYQQLTVNRQQSTVNRQPSTVNRQQSTVNH
jgi:hypothetical protein